ncbi:hypothetical protein [Tenacibaculum geojense]|uniref:Uncharacterized protein n=1 Tax=Tenacibaculum geojense TaxID=915352 RepID=A0ABW3JPL9_9FLAO
MKRFRLSNIDRLFTVVALVILLDFFSYDTKHEEKITNIKITKERYYNAAKNSHNSYQISTNSTAFYVSKKFAIGVEQGDNITYYTSLLFNEVNSYKVNDIKETYSLRIFSGLIIPCLALLALLFIRRRDHVLLTICKIILAANLVYLIL